MDNLITEQEAIELEKELTVLHENCTVADITVIGRCLKLTRAYRKLAASMGDISLHGLSQREIDRSLEGSYKIEP